MLPLGEEHALYPYRLLVSSSMILTATGWICPTASAANVRGSRSGPRPCTLDFHSALKDGDSRLSRRFRG